MAYIIAMDGPAGAGKSTIARRIASKLNFLFINSGGFFRTIALYYLQNNLTEEELEKQIDNIDIEQKGSNFFLNNVDVTNQISDPSISAIASVISRNELVRKKTESLIKQMAIKNNVVIEGRDTTTVVFPNATLKCWVFASPEIRAKRRQMQVSSNLSYEEILDGIKKRDIQDSTRKISPLKRADDAFDVDTSNITIEEGVDKICNEFYKRIAK